MCAFFVCDLLGFRTHEFPAKSEKKPGHLLLTKDRTLNSLFITTRDALNKNRLFSGGEILHATDKDAAQCISCIPIKPKDMIRIKCDMFFCD